MKIYTITCHDVYNHGASLQAYALMKYLENQGHNVEIIDYKPDYLSNHYNMFSIDNPKWDKNFISKSIYLTLKIPSRIIGRKRKNAFDKFTRKNLKITNKRYKSNEDLLNNMPLGDAYICGSDQIWNSLHRNGRDRAFYLNFAPDNKIKASYAASFATDFVSKEYENLVKENVNKLDGVGVREVSGVNILNNLGIKKAVNVLDPVFLLGKEEWSNIGEEVFDEKYLLVYDFDKNSFIEKLAKDIAKEKGYKIYTISHYKAGYEDRSFRYSGPETFVSLVRNAEFVISNSFHAVVFSLIYEKEVVIVNRTENINTRMRDLLCLVNLKERLVTEKTYNLDKLLNPINYVEVKKILNKNIKFSKNYLEKVLAIKK
ncbi:polysaccharide pyruvyl transferase family protein [Clostridium tarantellae]|uniref:Polysaccharide pyruvyl transferase family protein n=1 Tax=Clostridium tarantellae TaxID=39493 RepID=A0A6I1MGK0_9CLOT|nr:polysaccharide pyruvyl transferase family protein [Clostridium tarantellae]MPQ42300.1 polysaccharide pyruvyl transferase family protein [Clostridium tarantellae]